MKSSFMRPALTLALALGLAACGGKATFDVAGTVDGLVYPGLVLSTNGMDLSVPANATTFTFPRPLEYGQVYEVKVSNQPQHQFCAPTEKTRTDTVGRLAAISVSVGCTLNSHTIGGNVSGLTGAGVVLTNGSTGGTVSVSKETPVFTFPAVTYGVTYGVTVLTQPSDNSVVCSVSPNGTGTMGDAAVADIVVSCVPKK